MARKLISIEEALKLLAGNPQQIGELAGRLTAEQLHAPAADGGWSQWRVLAHVRACSDVWGDSIRRILSEDRPTFKAINPESWLRGTSYPETELHSFFSAFLMGRVELLALLSPLSPEAWSRAATVKVAGKPQERTVLYYADAIAVHERSHIKHMKRFVADLGV